MSRPPGLIAYLSLAALSAPAARRRIKGEIARDGPEAARLAERLGQPSARRPEGPLIWLHAGEPAQEGALSDLARRIAEDHPGAAFLVTTEAPPAGPRRLPPRSAHQLLPLDSGGPVAAFLDHWRPDIALWAGTRLRPALIHEAARRGTRLWLIDATGAPPVPSAWRRFPGLTASTLRRFTGILASHEGAAAALIEAGAAAAQVAVSGPLEEEAVTPSCNLRERDQLGELLKARPVWFAVAVPEAEEQAVFAAHRAAARMAHRLLLILVPADPARGPALAAKYAVAGLSVALRSVEVEPDAGTEIFVADSEGELGLWYRLAPVTFMGGTLAPGQGGGRSPLEPAALGSAILHGPETGPHTAAYNRFWSAEAARSVADAAALGVALSDLLSPDKAATMAHAAWRVSTGGAEVSERVVALVSEALTERAAS
ncbi:MAG: 3-deoxy-D-manno-octulosonic acid transferase [Paracoccaceae bacterium]|nr:3-deoxy-D-manno-octulosonic acid transferase [Paracoccaceae bacterium]